MICLCIGICQLGSIAKILNKSEVFKSRYKCIISYQVFNITEDKMKEILEKEVPKADLILSQPVSNNYKGTDIFSTKVLRETAMKYNKTHFVVSNCYFTGYDPNPFQTTNLNGDVINYNGVSYFPSISLESLIKGDYKNACINWCNPEVYSKSQLNNNIIKTLNELRTRESKIFDNNFGIDVDISNYISDNYLNIHLFHTYNHPTNVILLELSSRICQKLGLCMENVILENELLGDFSIPPPPCVYYGMGMKFAYPKFIINSKGYTTSCAMKMFIRSLNDIDEHLVNRWKAGISYGLIKLDNDK